MVGEMTAICCGVGNEQDDEVDLAVAALESNPAIERLEVRQPHLGFHRNRHAIWPTLGVPGSSVARDRQWNL